MEIEVKCEYCGFKFIGKRRNSKYCCQECYAKASRILGRERNAARAAEKAALEAEKAKKVPLWKINEEARSLGMSYGKYQALRKGV